MLPIEAQKKPANEVGGAGSVSGAPPKGGAIPYHLLIGSLPRAVVLRAVSRTRQAVVVGVQDTGKLDELRP